MKVKRDHTHPWQEHKCHVGSKEYSSNIHVYGGLVRGGSHSEGSHLARKVIKLKQSKTSKRHRKYLDIKVNDLARLSLKVNKAETRGVSVQSRCPPYDAAVCEVRLVGAVWF